MDEPDIKFKPVPRWIDLVTRNPRISAILVIFSFICNLFAIPGFIVTSVGTYYSREGVASRRFCFYLPLGTDEILRAQGLPGMETTYKGVAVKGDVKSCLVGGWNAGNESIHKHDVLEPVSFAFNISATKILDVEVFRYSRSVVLPVVDKSKLGENRFTVSWNILEHNDAFLLRVIFEGDQSDIDFSATIEGQLDLPQAYIQPEAFPFFQSPYGHLLIDLSILGISGLLLLTVKTFGNWVRSRPLIFRIAVALWLAALAFSSILETSSAVRYFKYQINQPPSPPLILTSKSWGVSSEF